MLHSKARWKTAACDTGTATRLAEQLNLHPAVARLLVARGMTSAEEAELFLNGGEDHLHDPFLLDGMFEAVTRVKQAITRGEKIRVYGDYDADGVTSTALMTHLLKSLQANFDTYIPHRMLEGYGLNVKAIEAAHADSVTLLITVDTGISAVDQIAYANDLGIDVIVTDHHEPPEVLPPAYVILNPKKPGCPYPNKQLAGVGVAWKLAHALLGELPYVLSEFAAIGTVADLMPLTGENRYLVKLGLERLSKTANPGIQALFQVCGVAGKEVTSTHLGFALAPRINASGRLQHAKEALRLLTTDDIEEANALALQLDLLNKERQRIVDEMIEEALSLLPDTYDAASHRVIVVAKEGWNAGVIGIVAAKLLERFYRPAIVLSIDPVTGSAKGSARSIAGYDIHRALTQCQDLLEHFGGHQAAGGMTLKQDAIVEFRARLNGLADSWLNDEQLLPELQADAEFALDDISVDSIRQIEALAPFGMGNPSPRIQLTDLDVHDMRTLGREKQHLKLQLTQGTRETAATFEAVGFGKGSLTELISPTAKLDLIGELSINEWNGVRKPQMVIQDVRVGELQVFDWRGMNRLQQKLGELDSLQAGAAKLHRTSMPVRAILTEKCFHWERDRVMLDSIGWAVYGWDEQSGAVPLNETSVNLPLSRVTDLVLYSLPESEASFQTLLKQATAAERVYPVFADWNTELCQLPGRDAFKKVYPHLLQKGNWLVGDGPALEGFARKTGLSVGTIRFILVVFEQVALIERAGNEYRIVANPAKAELESAAAYKQRASRLSMEALMIFSSAQELTAWIKKKRKDSNATEGIV